jgi:glyoxylase-like metal-dependent hydrolase (beta-lactamase superfamily II)
VWLHADLCLCEVLDQVKTAKAVVDIQRDVFDQLRDAGLPLESINAIIWSHHHMDHIGDPSLFPPSTSLVVGPGFKKNNILFPGYPANPDSTVVDDAFHGREVIELDFSNGLNIGGFPAIDFFEDGSFYILQSEGHSKSPLMLAFLEDISKR